MKLFAPLALTLLVSIGAAPSSQPLNKPATWQQLVQLLPSSERPPERSPWKPGEAKTAGEFVKQKLAGGELASEKARWEYVGEKDHDATATIPDVDAFGLKWRLSLKVRANAETKEQMRTKRQGTGYLAGTVTKASYQLAEDRAHKIVGIRFTAEMEDASFHSAAR